MNDLLDQASAAIDYSSALRREFHRHPELGFQEFHTAEIIVRELSRWEGFKIQSGLAGTGVLATLEGEKNPGKTVLLRFDMDALPVQEVTGAEYASEIDGLMHACGHDGHLAIGLTAARLLAERRHEFDGTVRILFQPAEEGLGGALKTIQAGVLEDLRPDYVLGMHLWNEKPLGWLGISEGPVMAASETFRIRIRGMGGHGAKPQEAIDPIVASAGMINTLQTLISREVHPLDSAVITVSTIHAGQAPNVIPAEAELTGTIRTFSLETRKRLLERFQSTVKDVAAAYRCQVEVSLEDTSPPVINHPSATRVVRQTAKTLFPTMEMDENYRTMASEDMAYLMQDLPGCYTFIGSANPTRGLDAKHHQPNFDFDEDALVSGTALMAGSALNLLKS
ncbi:MAG: M20 family metallopeptidase [Anaerolineales bacterium]